VLGRPLDQHREYKYTKKVGHELGLRSLDVCTGCGPGVMKGPMKGATIAHAKQRMHGGRYLGLTEPGIIAAEAPNPIVNELVILPDIESAWKPSCASATASSSSPAAPAPPRVPLPAGHPDAPGQPACPSRWSSPARNSAAPYLQQLHAFVGATLGEAAHRHYEIIIDDPAEVARQMTQGSRR
jgi:predicted Rossmann-fold nucleotide-binding protein